MSNSISTSTPDNFKLSKVNIAKGNSKMKVALGIHVGHDRGACLIKDNKVIAAISNERLDRKKYSQSLELPFDSINALLTYCGISISNVKAIGLSGVAFEGDRMLDWYKNEFFDYYKCRYIPFYLVDHHDAHAYSTYFSSGQSDSLIFVFDGGGDLTPEMQEAESIFIGYKGRVTLLDRRLQNMAVRHMKDEINHVFPLMPEYVQNLEMSIARKYSQITRLLGFGFGEEGKTMGLASFGKPMLDFLDLKYDSLNYSLTYKDIIQDVYAMQQRSNMNFREYICSEYANIAATAQSFVESSVISIISAYVKKYNAKNICVAGGLFLNCLTNHKLVEKLDTNNIFFLPSSGDDGQALGSAYYAYIHEFGYNDKFQISLPYLGLSYSDDEIKTAIEKKGLKYHEYTESELATVLADYISNNKIIALHRGRTEIGPRALCHRSILANPADPNMKDILNSRVKHREPFRPFAPTVLEEEQFDYFDLKTSSPYMLLAADVKEEYRLKLASITHIDNTARVQVVSKNVEPFIYDFLLELKKRIGFPIVLNTSFNVAGQPIVESPLDALNTFLSTDIDILAIGNCVIDKSIMLKQ